MPLVTGVELLEGSQVLATASSNAVIGLVGASAIGTPNQPFLIRNMAEAIARFGYMTPGATIPGILRRAFESYGQITFVVVNVASPLSTAVAPIAYTFNSKDQIVLPHKHINTAVVLAAAGGTAFISGTDFTADLVKGIIQRKGSAIAPGATVQVGYNRADFSNVTAALISGGVNPTTGRREGLEALIDAESVLPGFANVNIIIAPGFNTLPAVVTKMATVADRVRARYILDAPSNATLAEVMAGRTAGAAPVASFNTRDRRAILCFPNPMAKVAGVETEEPYSAHIACAMAISPDWASLTNQEIRGVSGWKFPLLTSPSDPLADNSVLAEVGIVSYRNRNGQNPVAWGNFNASYPEEDATRKGWDRIHVTRIIDAIRDRAETILAQSVGQRLGTSWSSAVAVIEATASQALTTMGNNDGVKMIYTPEKSDLSMGKLAFRLEIKIPGVTEIITVDILYTVA